MKNKISLFFSIIILSASSIFAQVSEIDVAVIGGGPAGLTAAIYTARAGLSTVVFEGDEPGGQIALSSGVENFPGIIESIDGNTLTENMKNQAQRFGGKVLSQKVSKLDLSNKPFLIESSGKSYMAKTVILATGASAKWLGLESEKKWIGKGVSSCAVCDGALYKAQEVVVVGGGDSALEDALFLAEFASKVTVIHRRDQLRASAHLQKKAFANPKIHFLWNAEVIEVCSSAKGVTGVFIRQLEKKYFYPASGIFVAIGHTPNSELFQGQITLRDNGFVYTEPFSTKTSIDGVFAAGDVVDFRYRQAITAAGSGCMAGLDAYQYLQQQNNK